MDDSRKSRSVLDADKHVIEFTSGQLVFTICVLLLIGLGCFLLGIVVDRLQTARLAPTSPVTEETELPQEDAVAPAVPSTALQASAVAPSEAGTLLPETGPRVVELPDPNEIAPPPAPSPPQPATALAAGTEQKPTAAGSLQPAAPPKERYALQVVSYAIADRAKAEEYKKRVESNTDFKVDLAPSPDGKFIRGLIGDYADRSTAEKAKEELSKRAGFANCFVQRRN
jgi:cell division septation protein DedD